MFSIPNMGHKYVDRGDPDGADFDQTDFTVVDTWTELDLSNIVPLGAKLVLLGILVKSIGVNDNLQFRKKGNTYYVIGDGVVTQIANLSIKGTILVSCDSDRKIEYNTNEGSWTNVDVTVKGWWI